MGQIFSRLNRISSKTNTENHVPHNPPTAQPDSSPITAPQNSSPRSDPASSIPSLNPSQCNSLPASSLPLVTDEILRQCPRFRVLVVGKSGVGKSSLISHAFGVDTKSVSHKERGVCDIHSEIISAQNDRFVLHDSMGFEPGEMKNFETVKDFLKSRSGERIELRNRVHVIWLCVQVPHSGGRVFETGDEELLKLASEIKVPVVVVFTQFDKLANAVYRTLPKNTPREQKSALCTETTTKKFQDLCITPLLQINAKLHYARSSGLSGAQKSTTDQGALNNLITITRDLVEREVEGEVWILSAMAQRANAHVKINASIEVGMKRYWEGLATSTKLLGSTLKQCLNAVHKEMTDSWNFYDPNDLLLSSEFSEKVQTLAQLVTPSEGDAKSWFNNLEAIQTWVGLVGATVAATAGPVIAAIGVSAWFINFIATTYRNTPETLRCFMGYIIDLTLVLHQLFLVVLPTMRQPRPLTHDEIDMALESYKFSDMGMVHHEIRRFVRETKFLLQPNAAEKKVKELIWLYSSENNPRSGAKSS
ncbi:G domain-containing protein [Mycena venus]|uniref:G domain-containing protein n=1 Tax=Mycena venus TaxID=2733690 RepID=A0A8H6Y0R0_9AGAR|nr:G domain-containing protein [Mycena venus]